LQYSTVDKVSETDLRNALAHRMKDDVNSNSWPRKAEDGLTMGKTSAF
jgi:hypothetical protein